MKKWIVRGAALASLVLLFALGPHVAWRLSRARTLDVVVVDKTVPFRNWREHAALPWLLHAMKVTKRDGRFLGERDYVGFDPYAMRGHDLRAEHVSSADALFVTDTYGVYRGDYDVPGQAALERSPKVYGGVTDEEAAVLEDFSASGRLLVAEFNTFASPTADGPRRRLEALFGVRWTGWVGRYWADLADEREVPRWVLRVYENVYHAPLKARGAAYVFVREDRDMVVLREGEHLEGDVISIERTAQAAELRDLPGPTSFRYWLDVLDPVDVDVIYEHRVRVTAAGSRLLAEHGLPERFPAFTRRRGRAAYYFAGDFVDTGVSRGSPERAGFLAWRRVTLGANSSLEESFFWGWYAPLIEWLIASRLP